MGPVAGGLAGGAGEAGGIFTYTVPTGTDIECILTLFSVPEGRTVEILLHYFPSLRDGQ